MIHFRQYKYTDNLFNTDFLLVRDFLLKLNNPTYSFGWWDQQITRPSFKPEYLNKFGLWSKNDRLAAVACVDINLGSGILCVDKSNRTLIPDMINYAKENLHNNGKLSLLIPDLDKEYQNAAANAGFIPTQDRDSESIMILSERNLHYTLPDGFQITSMAEGYDPLKFGQIMYRGFGSAAYESMLTSSDTTPIDCQFKRPFINLDLQIAILAPDESFAAFCGVWYTKESDSVFIEPVVTDPSYQKMGLGKAAVYEALKRCVNLGALSATVFSSIQFYFNIGFCPNSTSTWWAINEVPFD
ncbi:MAG: GNAT family N-acetyltransferase [Defluviitaleaceae bacterium]|nr:GNAT family N-acetyltransferase [Defluviitaleaceae bacterium]